MRQGYICLYRPSGVILLTFSSTDKEQYLFWSDYWFVEYWWVEDKFKLNVLRLEQVEGEQMKTSSFMGCWEVIALEMQSAKWSQANAN